MQERQLSLCSVLYLSCCHDSNSAADGTQQVDSQCLKIITETITLSPAFQNVRYWRDAWMQIVETRSLWTVNNVLTLAALGNRNNISDFEFYHK